MSTPEEEIAASQVEEAPPEDPGGGEGGTVTESPEAPPSPRLVQIGNLSVPEEELQSLLEFQNWARGNPDKMEAFGQYLRGEAQFIKERRAEPEEPKVDWSLVDPNIKAAYDAQAKTISELNERVQSFEEPLTYMQQEQMNRGRAEAQQAVDAAAGKIQERFKLNDDELDQLADEAEKLNIVPSLRAQGMAPQAALETALETAFWRDEKWRARVVDEEIASRGASDRKARASQVTGMSGGNGDGLSSRPANEQERRDAMASEIAEALRGTP